MGIDHFDQWPPFLQGIAFLAAALAGIGMWIVNSRKRPDMSYGSMPGTAMFFDGPIIKALEGIAALCSTLTELRADLNTIGAEQRRMFDEYRRLRAEELQVRRDELEMLRRLIDRAPTRRG